VIVCWSLKGGSGTTVVSAALALTLAQRNNSAVRIVDLAGDIPSVLGIAEPSGEGVTNWLQQPQGATETGFSAVSVSTTRNDPYITVTVTKSQNIPLFMFGWSVRAFTLDADVTIHIQDT